MSLIERPRRLRTTQAMRNLVAETTVVPSQLIYPTFIKEGLTEPKPIKGLPGVFQNTEASLLAKVDRAIAAGIGGIMIFGIPAERDELGSAACEPNGILNRAVAAVRKHAGDKLVVVADLCLDEFTSHGHCGVLDDHGNVDNDATLVAYGRMAVELAKAGAHMLGASGMMDGQVGYVRQQLDEAGYTDVSILAYSAKYASAFYGPFRDAVESELDGDRRTYQQDPRNFIESMREVRLDVEQGADIVMVKPALAYLDVIRETAQSVDVPVAAYLVSGEMAMIELAAEQGLIDRERAILEAVASVRRAGANVICTYWALELAEMFYARKTL
ncbi:porphobilinogen synthase [Rhodoluna limnophila]|uniref:porphobilinogen synthase n=1 Tax=Rhodoluna limnophila TaxID=232537 RepID=UPI0011062C3B|nr:porphobilinogen synthase [Rhodoluna limnophila]